MTIGNRVLNLLKEKGIKQKDLASYLGTSSSTINGWKSENRNPSSDLIMPICEFLNISCEFLLKGEDSIHKPSLSSSDQEWLDLIHKLPLEARYEFKGELKGYLRRIEETSANSSSEGAAGKSLA